VLKLVTLTIVDEDLRLIDNLHLRKLLLFAENCVKYGSEANGTKAVNDEVVACLLGVNFL
jgi:hypothetical protein